MGGVLSIPDLAHTEGNAMYALPCDPPVSRFPVCYDGVSCDASDCCQHVCRNRAGIQEHSKDEHGWLNQQKRGRDCRLRQPGPEDKIWKCNRACQLFFTIVDWHPYFEVAVPCSTDNDIAENNVAKSLFYEQKESLRSSKKQAVKATNTFKALKVIALPLYQSRIVFSRCFA